MRTTKVLVVDDSAFMRKYISDLINADPALTVVGTAKNGEDGVEQVKRIQPDVVTMDIEMPVMNGLQALEKIMSECPVPVIMLSSLTDQGTKETIMALEYGAFDFIKKPSGSISFDIHKVGGLLREKLKAAAVSRTVRTKPKAGPPPGLPPVQAQSAPITAAKPREKMRPRAFEPQAEEIAHAPSAPFVSRNKSAFQSLVAVGTSTGGPRALKELLSVLPEHFPAPIVIVQHMPANFTKSLAARLDSLCRIRVVEAANGQTLEAGTAYIAPGGFHMTVAKDRNGAYQALLNRSELRGGHRPSVDTLFESLLPWKELRRHIVLLTGMGSDGAKSMKALYDDGVKSTFAESEETCVVYGMPRSAIELNCVSYTLPLQDIAPQLLHVVK
ncbi:chemotaxis response regulator protein-glutamate methylesterase [Paenibacillus sp. MSJ-34]|uniref:protein-glutamate methylesterase/protein-glutamine glutaminase n=1 Tax=Paenibacillus sp. MSJ-34 TaxID=2841529 RepID=UPI001C100D80|nr:chemotaxis response regulator protein-glutamate methylesterase [Paenibacillus sp. MSJ-34]MBU5441784.1 chemotaxis response regulator protein-glutamate methylesterase [Paenibacillus sp. MSJ-34]